MLGGEIRLTAQWGVVEGIVANAHLILLNSHAVTFLFDKKLTFGVF